jgi:hypothetical protein
MASDETTVEIRVEYDLEDKSGEIRADFPSEDRDSRDPVAEALFSAVAKGVSEELEAEGVRAIGGGESKDDENAVVHVLGTDDDVPQM